MIATEVVGIAMTFLAVGLLVGWRVGRGRPRSEILARRLDAERRMEQVTRATLAAMRDSVRERRS